MWDLVIERSGGRRGGRGRGSASHRRVWVKHVLLGGRRWHREGKSQKVGLGTLPRGITGLTARAGRSGQACERPRGRGSMHTREAIHIGERGE